MSSVVNWSAIARVLAFVSLLLAAGPGSALGADTASIAGTVKGPDDQPVQGICVNVTTTNGGSFPGAKTGADGRFTVSKLPAGSYRVFYNDCRPNGTLVSEYYNDKPTAAAADPVSVVAGEAKDGIDAKLAMGGKISGTVTGPAAAPVQSVCVTATPASSGPGFLGPTVLTDAQGHYTLSKLVPRAYKVGFFDCRLSPLLLSEFYDDKPDFFSADSVDVTAGETTSGIDAELALGGDIAGTVTGPDDQPVQGICVSTTATTGGFMIGAQTGADGKYTVGGVPAGSVTLGFSDCRQSPLLAPQSVGPVTVTAGATTTGIDAKLATGGSISGTVTGPAAAALAGICIGIMLPSDQFPVAFATTDAGGHFTARALAPGKYKAAAVDCRHAKLEPQYFNHKSTFESADEISVAEGQAVNGIDFDLVVGGGPPSAPPTFTAFGPRGGDTGGRGGGSAKVTVTNPSTTSNPARPATTGAAPQTSTASRTARCVVPKLKGLKLKSAKKRLAAAHCAIGKVKRKKAKRKSVGRVLSQAVRAGRHLPAGTKVSIRLGKR